MYIPLVIYQNDLMIFLIIQFLVDVIVMLDHLAGDILRLALLNLGEAAAVEQQQAPMLLLRNLVAGEVHRVEANPDHAEVGMLCWQCDDVFHSFGLPF